ncbi:sulfatase-like hydrolase/transferase [Tabrizicola sp.]|uniref:sulfatase-like hydrolase/transferase n=1 Tax=Tabrizicola sp. TaxID=2005166 RepID=UPI00260B4577|nr:sulfatase-like hydrolase/transferase [Tabrizicola sp.]MDM7932768.1 sulfatase-like hydrolase/transferase [Tabrizicola sp.]
MERKNILLVSFDDAVAPWPYKTVFNEPLQTPNIDRLCAVSTAFHAAYAQAPICGPSRASMMTTMMPNELGIVDNSTFVFERVTPEAVWSHHLKEAGYFCSSGGKVHHRYKPLPRAPHAALYSDGRKLFSDDMGLPEELRRRARAYGGFRKGLGTPDGPDDAQYYDHQVADSAIAFLESYSGPQPFYREVGFFSPHVPHITPARFKEMYDAQNLRKPPDWTGYLTDNAFSTVHHPERTELRSEDFWQKTVRNYFSAYSHGDHHLGRVLDVLAASPHAGNTVIILVADHGFHLGNRNLYRKTTMWEQSLRVPFVIFDPADPVGRVVADPVALVDLGPTVLDFAGLAGSERRHGRSLRPMMTGLRDPEREVASYYGKNVSMRRGRYRIIRYADDSWQLFDVEEDFWQLRDLGTAHPAFAGLRDRLAAVAAGDGFDITAPENLVPLTAADGDDPED